MKRTVPILLCLLAAVPAAFALQATVVPTADSATHEELLEKLRKAEDPTTTMKPAEATPPDKIWKPGDLLARSDFFCLCGQATLVPKGAILHIPAQYADRLKLVEGSKILTWTDFFAANRGWIQTLEVTRRQAEGDEVFPEDTVKMLEKCPYVVVATLKGGPISVLPPKPEVAAAAAGQAAPAQAGKAGKPVPAATVVNK